MREVLINNRWPLILPEHRANFAPLTTPPYWETERLEHMYEHVKPWDIVYEIGSEEGDVSALLAQWSAPIGREPWQRESGMVLFEPNPRVWSNIKAIFGANEIPPPSAFWVGFAGDKDRFTDEQWSAWLTAYSYYGWPDAVGFPEACGPVISNHGFCNLNERPDLPAIRIDSLIEVAGLRGLANPIPPPDVITMDVEGSELQVLKGATQTLTATHDSVQRWESVDRTWPRPKLWISSHPAFQREMYGYTEADLLAFLDSVDYRYELIAEDHERHFFAEPR